MMTLSTDDQLKILKDLDSKILRLNRVKAVLEWDQETYLPSRGIEERARQLALLQGQIHDWQTSSTLGSLVEELSQKDSLSQEDRALVSYHKRAFDRESCLPKSFVERRAKLISLSQPAWAQARKKNDFTLFSSCLKDLVAIVRESANFWGYKEHPYDALLEDYEPFTTTGEIKKVFDVLEKGIYDLLKKIAQKPQGRSDFLHRTFPQDIQEKVGKKIISDLGFNWEEGRLDITTHPFCTTLGPYDVRITTRYNENQFATALYGMIHETGHAFYEQGFSPHFAETSLAQGTSMGIHESQSRFWENMVARSQSFIDHYFPFFRENFPDALAGVTAYDFYRAINKVEPSLIRVEADELTYGLHIILRFRLETALLDGSLDVDDVPQAWDDESEKLLGVRPTDASQGCLQDIHWSMGGFGYFPTYALGNVYAAQFRQALTKSLPDWQNLVAQGQFSAVLGWLRENVHRHGNVYPAQDLCYLATGKRLSPEPYLDYLNEKFGALYEL